MKMPFLKKMSRSHKAALLGILVVALVHSAGQLYFIQNETRRSSELAVQKKQANPPQELTAESEPQAEPQEVKTEEFETQKVEAVPEAKPTLRRSEENAQPPVRKKVVRETREARLRRAERILTGV